MKKHKTLLPGNLVISVMDHAAKFRIYNPDQPDPIGRFYVSPGDLGMYINTIINSPFGEPNKDDNLYLFGETMILVNTNWARTEIVSYEV